VGSKVRVISRNPPVPDELIEGVEYLSGSVTDLDSLHKASVGVDGIFHLAGLVVHSRLPEFQKELYETNVVGTLNVLRAAQKAGCKRVVYASTSGTIGCSPSQQVIGDDAPYCLDVVKNWPYYAGKIESEIKAKQYAVQNGIEFVMMRPSVMLGPGDIRFRSTHFILSFLDGGIPIVPPGGYSFVDVRDAAQAFKSAMEVAKPNSSYLLAADSPTTDQFMTLLSSISGAKKPSVVLPWYLLLPAVRVIDFYNRKIKGEWKSSMDPVRAEMGIHFWSIYAARAQKDLGFSPRPPIQTVTDTVNWIKENRDKYGHPQAAKL